MIVEQLCKLTRSFWTCLSGLSNPQCLRFVESDKDDIHVQLQLGPSASSGWLLEFECVASCCRWLHVASCCFYFQKYSYPPQSELQKSICVRLSGHVELVTSLSLADLECPMNVHDRVDLRNNLRQHLSQRLSKTSADPAVRRAATAVTRHCGSVEPSWSQREHPRIVLPSRARFGTFLFNFVLRNVAQLLPGSGFFEPKEVA